jgi:hypothetical protein
MVFPGRAKNNDNYRKKECIFSSFLADENAGEMRQPVAWRSGTLPHATDSSRSARQVSGYDVRRGDPIRFPDRLTTATRKC